MNIKPIPEPDKIPTRLESLMFVANAYNSHAITSPSMFGKMPCTMDAVYDAPQELQARKLSQDVLSISSRKIRVRAPNVTVKSTRKAVSSFCPKEKRNKMTQAGNGMFLQREENKRIAKGRMKPRFEMLAERRAKITATKAARTVLLMAMREERK